MKRFLMAVFAAFTLGAPAQSQNTPVVVELFTSQGCSSCPPADEIMEVLAARDDVIALSLHVDYWDYIGWTDEFAHPDNAKRQRAYANEAGRRSIYTPEMIVNGVSDIVGAKPMDVATAIERHKAETRMVALSVSRDGDSLTINAERLTPGLGPMVVQMLRYQPKRKASITRGENAGNTFHYVNVTQDWQVLGVWQGNAPYTMQAPVSGAAPVVVLIQAADHGAIMAAAEVR